MRQPDNLPAFCRVHRNGRPLKQMRASASRRVCAEFTWLGTEQSGHLRDKVAAHAHIGGGAVRLTEARVSIMQRKTKRRPDASAAECRRAAPYMRPGKISASTFWQVRAIQGNGLRSRARRFESCRGH